MVILVGMPVLFMFLRLERISGFFGSITCRVLCAGSISVAKQDGDTPSY